MSIRISWQKHAKRQQTGGSIRKSLGVEFRRCVYLKNQVLRFPLIYSYSLSKFLFIYHSFIVSLFLFLKISRCLFPFSRHEYVPSPGVYANHANTCLRAFGSIILVFQTYNILPAPDCTIYFISHDKQFLFVFNIVRSNHIGSMAISTLQNIPVFGRLDSDPPRVKHVLNEVISLWEVMK